MNSDNIDKVLKLFPYLSEKQIIYVKTYGRKANRANYVLLHIDSDEEVKKVIATIENLVKEGKDTKE